MLMGPSTLSERSFDDLLASLWLAPTAAAGTPPVLAELGLTGSRPIPFVSPAPALSLDLLDLSPLSLSLLPLDELTLPERRPTAATPASTAVVDLPALRLPVTTPVSPAVTGTLKPMPSSASSRPAAPAATSVRESSSSWLPAWLNPSRLVATVADALPTWVNPVNWFRSSPDAPTAAGRVSVSRFGNGYHLLGSLPSNQRPDRGVDRQAVAAFEAMQAAAARDGINLTVTSNYRSVAQQRRLWEASDKTGRWVARPGSSEHHTGLAFDIGTRGYRGGKNGNFQNSPAYRWLKENAYRFGFVQSMSWESWHWRFDPQAVRTALGPSALSGTALA